MTNYSHDWQGQLTAVIYSGFTAPNVIWTLPDSRGRYTQRTDGEGVHTLTYNDKGQLTGDAVTSGHLAGITTTIVPNALGQEQGLGVTVGGAPVVSHAYSYDPATGRLAGASDLLRNVSATYGYTANSNWNSAVNTSSGAIQRLETVRTPDGLGRLAAISSTVPGQSAPVESHTYHYNAKGLREEVNVAGGEKWVYGYNARNEVTSGVRRLDSGADVLRTPDRSCLSRTLPSTASCRRLRRCSNALIELVPLLRPALNRYPDYMPEVRFSGQQLVDDMSMHIGEAAVDPVVTER